MDFHTFSMDFMRFHGFQGSEGWRPVVGCGSLWDDHPGPKEEVSNLGGSNTRIFESSRLEDLLGLLGLLEGGWNNEV